MKCSCNIECSFKPIDGIKVDARVREGFYVPSKINKKHDVLLHVYVGGQYGMLCLLSETITADGNDSLHNIAAKWFSENLIERINKETIKEFNNGHYEIGEVNKDYEPHIDCYAKLNNNNDTTTPINVIWYGNGEIVSSNESHKELYKKEKCKEIYGVEPYEMSLNDTIEKLVDKTIEMKERIGNEWNRT